MAKITAEVQEENLTFPAESILELKILESEIKTQSGKNGDWEKVECKFKILGIQAIGDGGNPNDYDNWIGKEIWGSVPFKLTNHPENRLRLWAEAIFRQEIGIGFELDTDLFVNRQVRGVTGTWTKKVGGQEYLRHQVDALLPFAGGSASAGASAPAPAASAPVADPWGTPDPWGSGDEPPF